MGRKDRRDNQESDHFIRREKERNNKEQGRKTESMNEIGEEMRKLKRIMEEKEKKERKNKVIKRFESGEEWFKRGSQSIFGERIRR